GIGRIRISKKDDGPNVNINIPMGTYFADQGPEKVDDLSKPHLWLLTLVTTKSVTLKAGISCGITEARVETTQPPPAHREMRSVLRFEQADDRYFEVTASDDPDAKIPNLAPWNSS